MARKYSTPRYDRRLGRLMMRWPIVSFIILGLAAAIGWNWLQKHPQHNPYAPLDLRHPVGWATAKKLRNLTGDVDSCRAVLDRSETAYTVLPQTGEGACARPDRTQLSAYPLSPKTPAVTCPVATALELWRIKSLNPAAQRIFGSNIATIQHLGAFSCRRMYGDESSPWSEHATANAIDIAGFTLDDGTQISLINDWDNGAEKGLFLRQVRDSACDVFATVLSPDYNAAHADHFHLDQDDRWAGVCR